jgi:predicted thioesterase
MIGTSPLAQRNSLCRVTEETLATHTGSGAVDVFSTPNLVCYGEAAMAALRPLWRKARQRRHPRQYPTPCRDPPGLTVTAVDRIVEVDGRRLVFQVEAVMVWNKIGDGTHERFLVSKTVFNLRSREKSHKENYLWRRIGEP